MKLHSILKPKEVEGDEVWNCFIRGLEKSGIQMFLTGAVYICKYPPLSYYTKTFAFLTYMALIIFHMMCVMTLKAANGDIFRISETLFYFSIFIPVAIGYISTHRKQDVLEKMFNIINNEFHIYNLEDTRKLKMIHEKEHSRYMKIQKYLQYLIYVTYFTWAIGAPMYDILFGDGSDKINPQIMYDLPIPLWVPFETRTRSIVTLFYIAEALMGVSTLIIASAYLITLVGFSVQVITQLKMLGYSIRHLDDRANYLYNKRNEKQVDQPLIKNTNTSPDKDYFSCLHNLFYHNILHYNSIVSFFGMFLEFTQTLTAVILGEAVIVLCNGLFLLTTNRTINAKTIKFTLFVFASLIVIMLFCLCGTLISLQSEDIHDSLYFSTWYNFPESLKRSIRIMQIRTMRHLVFQAGIYPLNLNTFIELLRASYSIFNVLNYVNSRN